MRRRAVFLAAAALTLTGLALAAAPHAAAAPPASGDWVVTANETYANQTIVVEGNVFVRAPGNLTLINVTLEINSTNATRRGLLVEPGGRLATRDGDGLAATAGDRTVIRPLGQTERITFVAANGSTIDLRQSAIWGVGYTQSPPNASGVYIQTSAATLRNVTVFSSFFGIVFVGVTGQFQDLAAQNNTYNGFDIDATSNITVRGLTATDNGQAGVRVGGGRVNITGASLIANADGLQAVGGAASVALFDASGNANGFRVSNTTLTLSTGRITNATTAGVDATLAAYAGLTAVAFSDDAVGVQGALASTFNVQGGSFLRGTEAVRLRSAAYGSFSDLSVTGTSGDAVDIDTATVDFFRCLFESDALGGSVTASTGFGFLDSTLANATASGFTFTNSTGIYLHNPLFTNDKGRAVRLLGSSNALMDASLVAEVNKSVIDVRQLSVFGTLRLVDATVHAVAAQAWTVSGALVASNTSVIGDVAGASLALQSGASSFVRGLYLSDFDLRFTAASPSADVDGLTEMGSGELAATGANYTWHNVTQGPGMGRVRAGLGNLTLVGGTAASLRADDGGRVDLVDFTGNLATAAYAGSGTIREFWTTGVVTLWQASVPAPQQNFTLRDAVSIAVASGQTDGAGRAALGPVLAAVGTLSGVVSSNPHQLTAGAGSWVTSGSVVISAPTTISIVLNDTQPPALVLASPSPGASTRANPVVLTGNVSDGASGVASLGWSLDNTTFTSGGVADPFALSVPTPLETTYQVWVRAVDLAGNAAFATVTFRIDRTAPQVTLLQPSNGTIVRGPLVRFVGGTEIGATLTVNGTAVPLDAFGDFDLNLTLAEGDVSLPILAVDGAGNSFAMQVQLHVDSTPPAIVVASPPNGSTVGRLSATLVGYVEPGANLAVDGVAQLVAGNGSFSLSADLNAEGPNVIQLRSTDRAGNVNQTTWLLVRDTRAPVVAVEGFVGAPPFAINTTAPAFNITADEDAVLEATVAPGASSANGSGFQMFFRPALSEGNFTLSVRATDGVGNTRLWTFAFRVDVTAPNFTLDAGTQGGAVNVAAWQVQVTAEPGSSVTVGGVAAAATAPGSSTYAATVNLAAGENTLVITVTDSAGNRATRTVTLTLDQTPPALSLSSPVADLTTGDDRVNVVGNTEPGAVVTVDGRAVPVDATGAFATAFSLQKGSNNLVVTATDKAGNVETVQRTVTRSSSASHGLTGISFLDQNLLAILLLVVALAVVGALAARAGAKRRALGDKAAAIERDIEASRASRNDMSSLENFSPRGVSDPEFVSAEAFRSQAAQAEGEAAAKAELEKRKP